ncbi:hypothetical protein M0812_02210 [Anaeramoeba flamelloides]|uniref:Nucleosome assembly protein n=1 Tax=Anaeramoeba flamelloides TaxID=1746091 RepID=A0AAV7Z203_9EUKA|nr:hypothetical protein M0812_02210 [Anaeramoeba flamelloides]
MSQKKKRLTFNLQPETKQQIRSKNNTFKKTLKDLKKKQSSGELMKSPTKLDQQGRLNVKNSLRKRKSKKMLRKLSTPLKGIKKKKKEFIETGNCTKIEKQNQENVLNNNKTRKISNENKQIILREEYSDEESEDDQDRDEYELKNTNDINVQDLISNTCLSGLPTIVLHRIEELRKIQFKTTLIENVLQQKIRKLQYEYSQKMKYLFDKRCKIIKGEETQESVQGIPLFWLKVLLHHPSTRNMISERDEYGIQYLKDIQVELFKENLGYHLHFIFDENPYFTNTILTKTYYLSEEIGITNNLFLEKTEGTKIQWKKDQALTVNIEEITKKIISTGRCKTYRKYIPCKSFFHFFTSLKITQNEDEEKMLQIQAQLEADFQLGNLFKETLVPMAVLYFSGEALSLEDVLSNSSSSVNSSYSDSESDSKSGSSSSYSYSEYILPSNVEYKN